jgi:hypothetical protein
MLNIKKVFIILALSLSANIYAQTLSGYSFSASSGTFTPLISPTNIWVSGDDVTTNDIPIGFNFVYGAPNATTYTSVCVNSNGWIALGTFNGNYSSNSTNNLATTGLGPVIAPLWDDLSIGSAGSVNYQTAGTFGSRIFTVEWLNMKWYWGASGSTISFQVKLFESNGDIEFVYRQESGNVSSASASIGINNASATDFWSINNTSASPTASCGTETNSLALKPATGQVYLWSMVTTSLNAIAQANEQLNIFPNPFTDVLTISVSGNQAPVTKVQIIDFTGKKVFEKYGCDENSVIHFNDELLPGAYMIKVFYSDRIIMKRVVKI